MDDIEAIIEASKHFKYHEPTGTTPFNRLSSLPESKKRLKRAIRERMRLLAGAYLSLASFIDDDLVDFLEEHWNSEDPGAIQKTRRIFTRALKNMERLRDEIRAFDPTEIAY